MPDPIRFSPSFPIFILGIDGGPAVLEQHTSTAMGFSRYELAEFVVNQFRQRGRENVGLLKVGSFEAFREVARQLLNQSITHVAWDTTINQTAAYLIDLREFVNAEPEPGAD